MTQYMTAEQIQNWQPYALAADGKTPLERARKRVEDAGQWAPWQMMGRRFAIGCVALEVTQRCNLDCTYCYLSESSEALKDIPLQEVYRRIDLIHAHYGDNTDVQVTGGDPTLRRRDELMAIVRYIRQKKMRASFFTNGIKASRDMLIELCENGVEDVAFHVDMTQERKGYGNELAMNEIRQDYIERARGLPLSVFFNTTVYPANFHEVPELVKFFVRNSDVVRMAAFQVGADTGRGTDTRRVAVTPDTVQAQIEAGLGTTLQFGAASAGHSHCNRYAMGLVINDRVYDFLNDPGFVAQMLNGTKDIVWDRAHKRRTLERMAEYIITNPRILGGFAKRAAKLGWRARRDLLKARGKVGKLSFHIHNFQDSSQLDQVRCEACSFMVMTPEGPMSMCVHNAKRDNYLLVAAQVKKEGKVLFWNPATGQIQDHKPERIDVNLTRKNARGRAKVEMAKTRARKVIPA